MSALAHFIEAEGVATTGISLVRDHTERMAPPRFLWVPFELGRPFGAPDAPAFQTRVMRAALALLERDDGPPVLEDFPDDAPAAEMSEAPEGWTCPIAFAPPAAAEKPDLLAEIEREIAQLAPWRALAAEKHGRSALGAARMEMAAVPRFLHDLLAGDGAAANPVEDLSLGQAFRGAVEDLKTFYMEAATAKPEPAPSEAVADWFWGETAAGRLVLALHPVCLKAADAGVRRVAAGQLVPRRQQHRLSGTAS